MKKMLGKYGLLFALIILAVLLHPFLPGKSSNICRISAQYLKEVLSILPPVLILLGLLDTWVPRKIVEKMLGKGSGVKGAGIAVLTGTAAAGPLYVAFPVAASLLNKGASIFNTAVFLCSWSAIKIPMVMFEAKFLGWQFTGLRLLLTVPGAILTGFIMEKALAPKKAR